MLSVAICWKVHTQPDIASESTYGEIICMYKDFNQTKAVWRYMEDLALHTGAPTVHWEDNTIFISIV